MLGSLVQLCGRKCWGNVGEMEPQNAVPNVTWLGNHWLPILARSHCCENRLLGSLCLCVCQSTWNNSAPTDRIFIKFHIWLFFENLSRKFTFYYNLTRITGTLHEDHRGFLIISRSVLLRMRNVSHKPCRENPNTYVVLNNFLRISCRLWDNVEKCCRTGQATYDDMTPAHCMPDNWVYKNTRSEYETLIAFALGQWLHQRVSVLRLFVHCLSCSFVTTLIRLHDLR